MAYHHHHSHNPIPAAAPPCCSGHYSHCCSQPPPPPPSHDPLLEALTLLLQRQQPDPHTCLNKHHTRKNPNRSSQFPALKLHSQLIGENQPILSLISSLLQRITSLESSLAQFHAPSSSYKLPISLRDAAARVIQSNFRAYLVRRSRTLGQLQDLASIKSSFNSLKSSVSNRNRFNYAVVSQKAMDLLLKLDSVQGGDHMIRDGKRSISGNIVRFLEFIDALSIKNHGPVKTVRFVRNSCKSRVSNLSVPQKELVEKLSERVEKIRGFSRVLDKDEEDVELEGFQEFIDDDEEEEDDRVLLDGKLGNPKIRNGVLVKSTCGKPRVKKTVSFAENGNLCRIYSEGNMSDESDDRVVDNEVEERKDRCECVENDEVFQDQIARGSRREYIEINGCNRDEDGRLVFSPPLPVKMESRADLVHKRK